MKITQCVSLGCHLAHEGQLTSKMQVLESMFSRALETSHLSDLHLLHCRVLRTGAGHGRTQDTGLVRIALCSGKSGHQEQTFKPSS